MKVNYHTHNYRCNHATGTVDDYVLEAIKEGYDEIGISDHLPHPGLNFDTECRMKYEELDGYFNEIDNTITKYGDRIHIRRGIECEYFERFEWLYKEIREKYNIDYFILGVHFFYYKNELQYVGWIDFDDEILQVYVDYVLESMEKIRPLYVAHPDLFGMSCIDWNEEVEKQSRRIFAKAEELNIPLEINVNGIRKGKIKYNNGERYKYPYKEFWQLAKEYNVDIIVGIDAHNPEELSDFKMGEDFAKELGITITRKSLFK